MQRPHQGATLGVFLQVFQECRGSLGYQASLGCLDSLATSKESKETSEFPACLDCQDSLVCLALLVL